jgi:ubiquinone/menaquinone biosynthesis C-methylase UbiE
LPEFTGERVIPGLVDANLFNEHLARYRFAARFAQSGGKVLDAGCGSGYGTAEFGNAASVIAMDISADAISHARKSFSRPGVRFLQAACERLPFADESFDLVTTFEVIEHLVSRRELLDEVCRVLKPGGTLLVSTPNKEYYAESRAGSGPNPFHCHEFEYKEFQAVLQAVFPHVRIWTQNHGESIVFAPLNPQGTVLDAGGDGAPDHAHFFFAACSQSAIFANEVYAWMPATGNALREREHHVAKLKAELAKKDAWLQELAADHAALQSAHEKALAELRSANLWAQSLNGRMAERDERINELQTEAESRLGWIRELEGRIRDGTLEIERGVREIERLNVHRAELEADLAARAKWGQSLDAELLRISGELTLRSGELAELSDQLRLLHNERRLIANSKWIRLGRKLNLGPAVSGE